MPKPFYLALFALGLVLATRAFGHGPGPYPAALLNGGFEEGKPGEPPLHWSFRGHETRPGCSVLVSRERPGQGAQCALLSRGDATPSPQPANLYQCLDAETFRGRRVRLRASVRTEPAGQAFRAHLWLDETLSDGERGRHTLKTGPIAVQEWTPFEIVTDIDPDAQTVAIGLWVFGEGRAALDDVTFRSLILTGPTDFRTLPSQAPFPAQWPPEAAPWLASTWCVASNNPRIRAAALEARHGSNDVLDVVGEVLARSKAIRAQAQGHVSELTAVEALDHRGSCTSNANLVAALLRGAGVPARILAGYPLWYGPLQTHYQVEAFVPGFGWYPLESTMGKAAWPNFQQINVAIVPPANEGRAKAGRRASVAGGVPWLSLTELLEPAQVSVQGRVLEEANCDHQCRLVRPMRAEAAAWAEAQTWARARWSTWLGSKPTLHDGAITFGPAASAVRALTPGEVRADLAP